MRILRLFVVFAIAFQSQAQGGWKKKYFFQNDSFSVAHNIIETPTGEFIAIGFTSDTCADIASNRLTLLGMDKHGNQLWKKSYGDSTTQYTHLSNNNVFDNTGFYQTVSLWDFSMLIKFDYKGDTLWQKKYYVGSPGDYLTVLNLSRSVDGGFLMTGVYEGVFLIDERCLVIKTDKYGNEIWRKIAGIVSYNSIFGRSIVQDSATKTIIVTGSTYDINNPCGWLRVSAYVAFLDSLGNIIKTPIFNNGGGDAFNKVIQLSDKNFLSGGANLHMNQIYKCPLLVKFDVNGKIIWSRQYSEFGENNHIDHFYELPNKDIVVVSLFDDNYFRKLLFLRLDKNGSLIEKKYFGSPDFQDTLSNFTSEKATSMHATRDGGFILTTSFPLLTVFWSTESHPYSIIKLDAEGCDTTSDACSKNLLTNMQESQRDIEPLLSLYPNPTSEILNVETNAYITKEYELEIQDLRGKPLEKLCLQRGIKLRVNTSVYPPGLYLVYLRGDGKRILSKKLSIIR